MDHGAISRAFRQELATDYNVKAPYRWGVISAVHLTANSPTVDVKLDGSSNVTVGLTYLASYCPVVGDNVVIGRMPGMTAQSAHFVLGPIAGTIPISASRKILKYVAPGGTNAFTWASLPGSYDYATLEWCARSTSAGIFSEMALQFNGDVAGNYAYMRNALGSTAYTTQTAASQTAMRNWYISAASADANAPGWGSAFIPFYSGTTFIKTARFHWSFIGNTSTYFDMDVEDCYWNNTAAISSMIVTVLSGNFVAGSIFTLTLH